MKWDFLFFYFKGPENISKCLLYIFTLFRQLLRSYTTANASLVCAVPELIISMNKTWIAQFLQEQLPELNFSIIISAFVYSIRELNNFGDWVQHIYILMMIFKLKKVSQKNVSVYISITVFI